MMRQFGYALFLVMIAHTIAVAQPRGRGPGSGELRDFRGSLLINLRYVRQELGVDPEQAELLDALHADLVEQRQAVHLNLESGSSSPAEETPGTQSLESVRGKLADFDARSEDLITVVLTPSQAARLKQLYLQRDGLQALYRPEVASQLSLTEEQSTKLREKQDAALRGLPTPLTPEQQRQRREQENQELRELLTAEQLSAWEALLGEPFDFPAPRRRGNRER